MLVRGYLTLENEPKSGPHLLVAASCKDVWQKESLLLACLTLVTLANESSMLPQLILNPAFSVPNIKWRLVVVQESPRTTVSGFGTARISLDHMGGRGIKSQLTCPFMHSCLGISIKSNASITSGMEKREWRVSVLLMVFDCTLEEWITGKAT